MREQVMQVLEKVGLLDHKDHPQFKSTVEDWNMTMLRL